MQQMVICPHCGAQATGQRFCISCGARLQTEGPQHQARVWGAQSVPDAPIAASEALPARKYLALRAVATVYRIIGWVVIIGGPLFSIALAVIAAQGTKEMEGLIPWASEVGMLGLAFFGVVITVLYGLSMLAFADLCYVLIDIERNTRPKNKLKLSASHGSPVV